MDLSTLDRVRSLLAYAGSDTSFDTLLQLLVTSYSNVFERELNRHAQTAARTEVYRVRFGRRTLSLRGAPLTANPTSIKYSGVQDWTGTTALQVGTDYVVDLETGLVTFLFSPRIRYGWAQVVYTAGMGANTAAFIAAYPAIAEALDLQVVYHFKRRHTPGGNKVVEGGSTNFFAELGLLENARRVLDQERRHFV